MSVTSLLPTPTPSGTPTPSELTRFMSAEQAKELTERAHAEAINAEAEAQALQKSAAAVTSEVEAASAATAVTTKANLKTLAGLGAAFDPLDFRCDYGYGYNNNMNIMLQVCATLSQMGC